MRVAHPHTKIRLFLACECLCRLHAKIKIRKKINIAKCLPAAVARRHRIRTDPGGGGPLSPFTATAAGSRKGPSARRAPATTARSTWIREGRRYCLRRVVCSLASAAMLPPAGRRHTPGREKEERVPDGREFGGERGGGGKRGEEIRR